MKFRNLFNAAIPTIPVFCCLAVSLQAQLQLTPVEAFSTVTAIEHAGDDRLFVVEKQGIISIKVWINL